MTAVTNLRTQHPWLLFLLPVSGLAIVALYRACHFEKDSGTNTVLAMIHAEKEIPARMAPLIFISTMLTHLCGGSSGREGAALQIGGSLGNLLGRVMRLQPDDRRVLVMCGMSAAFSAVFGTPLAAVFLRWKWAAWVLSTMQPLCPASPLRFVQMPLQNSFGWSLKAIR